MKIINRNDLLKFELGDIKEYLYFQYNSEYFTNEERAMFYEKNPLAYYLFINDLQVLENQLEDIIEYLECKGR